MSDQVVSRMGWWAVVKEPCEDREGDNYYVTKNNQLLGSLDCLANEGEYEEEDGALRPVPENINDWLWDVIERHY